MESVGDRIKKARIAKRMTQDELAQRWGIRRVSVTQWEQGKTTPGPDKIPGLIELFGGNAEYWLGGDAAEPGNMPVSRALPAANASPPVPVQYPTARLPMLGTAVGGEDGRFVLNGSQIGDALCPPQLLGVPNAYGVFVNGTSMEPRYHPGEAVFVNPHLPVRQGDYVVVQVAGEFDGDDLAGYVKRFVSMNSRELVLEQFQDRELDGEDNASGDRRTIRIARQRVVAVHKIVASGIA